MKYELVGGGRLRTCACCHVPLVQGIWRQDAAAAVVMLQSGIEALGRCSNVGCCCEVWQTYPYVEAAFLKRPHLRTKQRRLYHTGVSDAGAVRLLISLV